MTRARIAATLVPLLLLLPTVTAPQIALACSCMPQTVADLPAGTTVIVGTIGARLAERRPILVERWFSGANPEPTLVAGFDEMTANGGSSCSISVTTGETLFLAFDRASLVSSCTMHARVDTEYGRELVTAATARYGSGVAPPPPMEPAGLPQSPEATTDLVVVGGGIGLAVIGLFGGLILLARRDRGRAA